MTALATRGGEPILVTQDDVRSLQLAKGAIQAGVSVLLEKSGYAPCDVPRVLLTGALGTSVSIDALKRVALLPEPMVDKVSLVSNAVLAGLQKYLFIEQRQDMLDMLITHSKPFPLSGTPAFEKYFMNSLGF